MAALVIAITTPQRSSPPGLGGELGPVFPALVRARNDCFVALDLDPGNLGLALGASFTTIALEKAHGHSPFCQTIRDSTVAEWLAGCGLMSRRATGDFSAPLNGANSGNPTSGRN